MVGFIRFTDHLSSWVGKAFAWCILVLTLAITYEVFVRYVLRAPTPWAFDISIIMYGTLFMMAGAYTLSRDGHVRGDVIYRLWPPKVQARISLILYFVFFFPGVIALTYAGYEYAADSWSYRIGPWGRGEVSINSPAMIPVSPLKTLLPIAAFMLLLQGIAEVCRCIVCLRTGAWPERLRDVEELDVALLHQHEHKDASEVLGERAKGISA